MKDNEIQRALSDQPWSLGVLLFGLSELLDSDGRPVVERRAPSHIKTSVPMELRPCPYPDERKDLPMNVSALAQVTKHFDAVLQEIAAFLALMAEPEASWSRMVTAVVDQLSGPAFHLLRHRTATGPVPALQSVGHKVAAGFFEVLRRRLVAEARGVGLPPTTEAFLSFVRDERALVGNGEVCAGPAKLIAKASEVFLHGAAPGTVVVQPWRVAVARFLAGQLQLAIAWQLFDAWVEREVFFASANALVPRNAFVADKWSSRDRELEEEPALPVAQVLAAVPGPLRGLRDAMAAAMAEASPHPSAEALEALLAQGDGAFTSSEAVRRRVARCTALYLQARQRFTTRQLELERSIRGQLGYDPAVPVRLGALMLPPSRSLAWFEMVCGHRLQAETATTTHLVFHNHRRTVDLTHHFAEG